MLPDEVDARLRREARRLGVSVAEVARQAIERHVPAESAGPLSFFAVGDGEPDDVSERVDEFVGEAVNRRHLSKRS